MLKSKKVSLFTNCYDDLYLGRAGAAFVLARVVRESVQSRHNTDTHDNTDTLGRSVLLNLKGLELELKLLF